MTTIPGLAPAWGRWRGTRGSAGPPDGIDELRRKAQPPATGEVGTNAGGAFALRAGVNRGRGEDASSDSHDPVLVTSRCWGDDKRSRLQRVLEIYRKGVGGAGRVPFQALELPVRVPTQSPGCRTFARASAFYLRTTKSLRSSRDSANSRGYGPAKTAKASSGRLFPRLVRGYSRRRNSLQARQVKPHLCRCIDDSSTSLRAGVARGVGRSGGG